MIRQASKKDLIDILEIHNDAILNSTAIYEYEVHTLEEKIIWYENKIKEGYPLLVFELDGKVVGFATFGPFRPRPAYKYSIEHSVYVHKDYRGQRIATQLLNKLIDIANELNYAIMIAGIDAENHGSIKIHEKLGFKFCGRIAKAGFKFGRWLDLGLYQLNLKGPKNPIEE